MGGEVIPADGHLPTTYRGFPNVVGETWYESDEGGDYPDDDAVEFTLGSIPSGL